MKLLARIRHLALAAATGLAILIVAGALPGSVRPVAAATNCDALAADLTQDPEEQSFLNQINTYRAQNGLVPLSTSPSLTRASTWMAADMAAYNYFNHTDRLGRQWDQRMEQCDVAKVGQFAWSENIAAWYDTGVSVFGGWKNSPGHNTNMLNPAFRSIGIARVASTLPGAGQNSPGWYWVTNFSNEVIQAAPAPVAPPANTPCVTPTIDVRPSTNYGIVGSAFEVIGTATCSSPVFQFWVGKVANPNVSLYDASVQWVPMQLYSAANSFTWRPEQTGYYYVTFWAKNGINSTPANGYFDTGLQLNLMIIQ